MGVMIGYLKGKIRHKKDNYVIVETCGVGYKVFTATTAAAEVDIRDEAEFWTHLAVRENALDLYGFDSSEQLEFFELLITVSGIGPKSALGIMDLAEVTTLKQAVRSGDPSHLTKVSGIGKKSAEKIVLELKEKMGEPEKERPTPENTEVLDALMSMGYSASEAREAARKVPTDVTETAEQIREALKKVNE